MFKNSIKKTFLTSHQSVFQQVKLETFTKWTQVAPKRQSVNRFSCNCFNKR